MRFVKIANIYKSGFYRFTRTQMELLGLDYEKEQKVTIIIEDNVMIIKKFEKQDLVGDKSSVFIQKAKRLVKT